MRDARGMRAPIMGAAVRMRSMAQAWRPNRAPLVSGPGPRSCGWRDAVWPRRRQGPGCPRATLVPSIYSRPVVRGGIRGLGTGSGSSSSVLP